MKKTLTLIFAFISFTALVSQTSRETKLLDKLNSEACAEINKTEFSKKDKLSDTEMKLGLALLPAFTNNQKEIKDVWGLDVNNQDDMRKVGEKLGAYMVYRCDKFKKIALQLAGNDQFSADMQDKTSTSSASTDNTMISGTIDKIEGTDVNSVFVKTDDGETIKLLWLDKCDGSQILEDFLNAPKSAHYKISYRSLSVFQPKLKSYQTVKVISSILGS